ncbi:tRNA (cmo5U34)-methyltransferase, partial [Orchesella cincta]
MGKNCQSEVISYQLSKLYNAMSQLIFDRQFGPFPNILYRSVGLETSVVDRIGNLKERYYVGHEEQQVHHAEQEEFLKQALTNLNEFSRMKLVQ